MLSSSLVLVTSLLLAAPVDGPATGSPADAPVVGLSVLGASGWLLSTSSGALAPRKHKPLASFEAHDERLEQPRVLVPAITALGLAAASIICYAQAWGVQQRLQNGDYQSRGAVRGAIERGESWLTTSFALGAGAVTALGLSLIFYYSTPTRADAGTALAFGAGGVMLAVGGRLP